MTRGPRSKIPRASATCAGCGKIFGLSQAEYRKKIKRNKSGKMFCSKKCYDKHKCANGLENKDIVKRQERIKRINAKIALLQQSKETLMREILEIRGE